MSIILLMKPIGSSILPIRWIPLWTREDTLITEEGRSESI